MVKVERVRCLKLSVFNAQLNLEYRKILYVGFQPFMKPYSLVEGQKYSTLHVHNSVRTSQYNACCQQKAQSVDAVKGNNGSVCENPKEHIIHPYGEMQRSWR